MAAAERVPRRGGACERTGVQRERRDTRHGDGDGDGDGHLQGRCTQVERGGTVISGGGEREGQPPLGGRGRVPCRVTPRLAHSKDIPTLGCASMRYTGV